MRCETGHPVHSETWRPVHRWVRPIRRAALLGSGALHTHTHTRARIIHTHALLARFVEEAPGLLERASGSWERPVHGQARQILESVLVHDSAFLSMSRACLSTRPDVSLTGLALCRSKLNTRFGRSTRFGRPSRSGDTHVDKTALSTRGTRCLSTGAHTPHVVNWWMGGATYHPINKPYDITAALLESTCATASSPVYLNWSAPHMSSHTSWKIRSSILS